MSTRGAWSSRAGFILAGAGSAIGLGAIWRFPYMTGDNGGAVFVIVFLVCCFFIGYPVMIAELTLGRNTEKNPVGMFQKLSGGGRLWKIVGGLCVLSGFTIFSWYAGALDICMSEAPEAQPTMATMTRSRVSAKPRFLADLLSFIVPSPLGYLLQASIEAVPFSSAN